MLTLSPADELTTLRVGVAPRTEFERVGIDRPGFLDDMVFAVEPISASSARIRVTSSEPFVEPFLTFLMEAEWSGGRLIREYTVLLDPPTFLPTPEAPAVAAPTPSDGSGARARSASTASVTTDGACSSRGASTSPLHP